MPGLNLSGALSGGLGGAQLGGMVGGLPGALGGGALGGVAGLFGKKKKKKAKRVSTLDPSQQALYNDSIAGLRGEGQFADLYNFNADQANDVFNQNVARPAYRGFQENIIPQITGQFRGQGIGNSSYTGEALSRAGRNVQENLDAQRAAAMYQGQEDVNSRRAQGIDKILNMQTFNYERPQEKRSFMDQILGAAGSGAGEYVADIFKSNRSNPFSSGSYSGRSGIQGGNLLSSFMPGKF